jgi:hypothetical protein
MSIEGGNQGKSEKIRNEVFEVSGRNIGFSDFVHRPDFS